MFEDTTGHICKDVWKPAMGKILHAQQELDNAVDKFAVRVVKNNERVGHLLCEYSRNFVVFNCRGSKKCLEGMTGRIAVYVTANSCVEEWRFLVGWCSVVQLK